MGMFDFQFRSIQASESGNPILKFHNNLHVTMERVLSLFKYESTGHKSGGLFDISQTHATYRAGEVLGLE